MARFIAVFFMLVSTTASCTDATTGCNLGGLVQSVAYPCLCLHAQGPKTGDHMDLVPCNNYALDQLWNIQDWDNYGVSPGPLTSTMSNKSISVDNMSTANGGVLSLYGYGGAGWSNQNWKMVQGATATEFQLAPQVSGKCLTAENKGAYVDQWDCLGGAHQKWKVIPYGEYDGNCQCTAPPK